MNQHDPSYAAPPSQGAEPPDPRRRNVMEPLIMLAFVIGWIVLQAWVLPKMGIQT
jgi:hypothetical protein